MTVSFESEQEKIDELFGDRSVYRARIFIGADYAAPVNYGGEPHWPPLRPMFKWTDRMGWENYGLDGSMKEGDMWDYVDQRRNARKPLPAAFLLASHIADEGTEAMYYASDAFSEAQSTGDAWIERNYEEGMPLDELVLNLANWTLEMAQDNLMSRVSSASHGASGLLGSMQPAELVE
jgi:hypothetical protein